MVIKKNHKIIVIHDDVHAELIRLKLKTGESFNHLLERILLPNKYIPIEKLLSQENENKEAPTPTQ